MINATGIAECERPSASRDESGSHIEPPPDGPGDPGAGADDDRTTADDAGLTGDGEPDGDRRDPYQPL